MNMSDDISAASIQMTTKVVGVAAHAARRMIDLIAKLLMELAQTRAIANRSTAHTDVHNIDLTNPINSGSVSMRDLLAHCRANRENLSTSEHGLTRTDAKAIASRCRRYGIPIAFTNIKGGENIFANIRQSDLPVFRQICTECIKDKIATRPQELANFKCKAWEIPFITAELNKYDLSAQFAQTKNGEYFAMFEAKDAKAVKIARAEFVKKWEEIEKYISIDKNENGDYTIKDMLTGRERDIDSPPNRNVISEELQKEWGIDANKADMIAAKFGQETLTGEDKKLYFSESVRSEFSYVSKVTWDDESILTKPYDCYYITPKQDGKPKVVYQDENGAFAILDPPHQTKKEMREIIASQLGINDIEEQNALIDKAEHVAMSNARFRSIDGATEGLHDHTVDFPKEAFDMSDPEVASGFLHEDADGNVWTKKQPVETISTKIERDGDKFKVVSTATSTETNQNGDTQISQTSLNRELSFSNKKTALQELKEMYKSQGVPEAAAADMAKAVFHKAELQSAEKIIAIERTTRDSIMVSDISTMKELPAANRTEAIEVLKDKYGLTQAEATVVYEKHVEDVQQRIENVQKTRTDYNTALNRLTEREENNVDTMVMCFADDPQKYISVSGSHNGKRVVHDYDVYDGPNKLASLTDANTKTESGTPVVESNGRNAWTNIKNDMRSKLGMKSNSEVLTFDNEGQYRQYLNDKEFLDDAARSETEVKVDTNINEPNADILANGHEMHPEGNILNELSDQLEDLAEEAPSMGGR